MSDFYVSARRAVVNQIKIFEYKFNRRYYNHHERRKLKKKLEESGKTTFYSIENEFFYCFSKLESDDEHYHYEDFQILKPPFKNEKEISSYLTKIMVSSVANDEFKKFPRENSIVTNNFSNGLFMRLNCIELKAFVQQEGESFLFFLQNSKYISSRAIDSNYLNQLKQSIKNNSQPFSVQFFSIKENLRNKIRLNDKTIAKFDTDFKIDKQHYLATFKQNEFGKYFGLNEKDSFLRKHDNPNQIVKDIKGISEVLKKQFDNILFDEDILHSPQIATSKLNSNIEVGNYFQTHMPKAAYYNGIYKPVDQLVVQEIYFNRKEDIPLLNDLFNRFNFNYVEFLKPIFTNTIDFDINLVNSVKKSKANLVTVFTKENLQSHTFQLLNSLEKRFHVYLGEIDNFKLSNFVAYKCLESVGGIVSIIPNLFVDKNTIFIGFTKNMKLDFKLKINKPSYALKFFNYQGIQIAKEEILIDYSTDFKSKLNKLSRNCEEIISNVIKKYNQDINKVILHTDGSINNNIYKQIQNVIRGKLKIKDLSAYRIQKSKIPSLFIKSESKYSFAPEKSIWYINENTSVIVTSEKRHASQNSNPIMIEKIRGGQSIEIGTEQILWLTRVANGNLYLPSRTPATINR